MESELLAGVKYDLYEKMVSFGLPDLVMSGLLKVVNASFEKLENIEKGQIMTKQELEAIKKRCATSTQGPWAQDGQDIVGDYGGCPKIAETQQLFWNTIISQLGSCPQYSCHWEQAVKDGEFIANSRQDIPALIAEVESLQARLKTIEAETWEKAADMGLGISPEKCREKSKAARDAAGEKK